MKDLLEQIKRFQKLKDITGCSKTSSYELVIKFNPWNDYVDIEFGGYDIGTWSRHEELKTTQKDLLIDLKQKVDEAVAIVCHDSIYEELDDRNVNTSCVIEITHEFTTTRKF